MRCLDFPGSAITQRKLANLEPAYDYYRDNEAHLRDLVTKRAAAGRDPLSPAEVDDLRPLLERRWVYHCPECGQEMGWAMYDDPPSLAYLPRHSGARLPNGRPVIVCVDCHPDWHSRP